MREVPDSISGKALRVAHRYQRMTSYLCLSFMSVYVLESTNEDLITHQWNIASSRRYRCAHGGEHVANIHVYGLLTEHLTGPNTVTSAGRSEDMEAFALKHALVASVLQRIVRVWQCWR